MFTPPPSPQPQKIIKTEVPSGPIPAPSSGAAKRLIGRRTKWTVLTIPVILILVTLSTRFITHPILFDVFESGVPDHWPDKSLHARHLDARQQSSGTSTATGTATSTSSTVAQTAQPLPTVPSTTPVLPTPFPQPLDATLSKNFSVSCYNFFTNMTSSAPFRQCRAFSLLLESSSQFLDAQSNLTLMNNLVWGTCNAPLSKDQCNSNLSWFANDLQSKCSEDLAKGNLDAKNTLMALQSFEVMHDAACLIDPNTNAYCYVEAIRSTNPSEQYYYNLPLGTKLPSTSKSTCSSCTKSLLSLYQQGLSESGEAISGLAATYHDAAQHAITDCGSSYATMWGNGASPRALFSISNTILGFVFVFICLYV